MKKKKIRIPKRYPWNKECTALNPDISIDPVSFFSGFIAAFVAAIAVDKYMAKYNTEELIATWIVAGDKRTCSEGDISKQLFLSWCGFESTSSTTDPSPASNSEPARTQGKVTKQLSQSEKQLLQYGQQSLEKIGRSFGKAKLNALCKQMEH